MISILSHIMPTYGSYMAQTLPYLSHTFALVRVLLNKLKYVLDKKDLNVAKLRRSPGEAILQVWFQSGTIRLKNDDWKVLLLHDGTLSTNIPAIDKILIKSRMKSNTAAKKSVLEWVKLQIYKDGLVNVVKWRKYTALWSSQILYIFVLRVVKIVTFCSKMVILSVCNANIYKICEFHRAIFSSFYNNSQPNFAILLIWRCSFQLW
jgi:hypothetical protein